MFKSEKGRITQKGAEHIRKLRAEGKTYQEIAQELGVSITSVYLVCKNKTHAK